MWSDFGTDLMFNSDSKLKKLMDSAIADRDYKFETLEKLLDDSDFINECKWNQSPDQLKRM